MLKKSLVSLLFILLFLLIGTSTGYAAEKFIVRVIYFKAQGADPVNHEKYNKIMKDTQDFFRNEMIRHGYGDKLSNWKQMRTII